MLNENSSRNNHENNEILNLLITQIADSLKMSLQEVEAELDTPFLELGADSLLLGNFLAIIMQKFNLKIKMQQLFDELETPNKLYEYLVARDSVVA